MLRFFSRSFNILIRELDNVFAHRAQVLISERRFIFAAHLVQRGLEAQHKFLFHLKELQPQIESLNNLRYLTDIPWETINWESYFEQITSIHENLIECMAILAVPLADVSFNDRLPDYFGQIFSVLAEECFQTIAQGNDKLFAKIFRPFFFCCLMIHERVRQQLSDKEVRVHLALMTDPIEDLLEISGYALIFSELDDNESLWKTTKQIWDQYLEKNKDSEQFVLRITTLVNLHRTSLITTPRKLVRTKWKQSFTQILISRGLTQDISNSYSVQLSHHQSPLIRVLTQHRSIFIPYDALDVFLALYLAAHSAGSSMELSKNTESFINALQREQNRASSGSHHDDDDVEWL